jgi:hypothetical protein
VIVDSEKRGKKGGVEVTDLQDCATIMSKVILVSRGLSET